MFYWLFILTFVPAIISWKEIYFQPPFPAFHFSETSLPCRVNGLLPFFFLLPKDPFGGQKPVCNEKWTLAGTRGRHTRFWMCALSLHRRPLTEFPSSGEVALPRETGEHGGGWCLKGGVVAASTNANPFCSEKIVAVYICRYHPGPWPPLLPGGGEFRYHRFN